MSFRDGIADERTARLDSVLQRESLQAVWFARPNSFAWLTGGDNVVDRATQTGIAAAGYDGEEITVLTTNIEAQRLRDEQLPDSVSVESYEWYSDSLAGAVRRASQEPAGADFDVPGLVEIDASQIRQPLTDRDVERYRTLGSDVAETLETVCRGLDPAETERAVSARLRGALAEQNIDAQVSLVGGGERARSYRHYTPTDTSLGKYALVSVSAQRHGLVASCTRTVAFEPPAWLERRHAAAARVEATALAATREAGETGGSAGDVFDAIQSAYDRLDWTDEWIHHHQGGAAGFAGREWIATPGLAEPVVLPMGYAWNPTVQGAKSEGTVLVTDSELEPLTSGNWPTAQATAVGYEQTVERPAVLAR